MHPFESAKKKINQLLSMDRMADAIKELKPWATDHQDLYAELDGLGARLDSNQRMRRKEQIDIDKYIQLQNQAREAFQGILMDIDQLLDIKKMSEASIRAVKQVNLGRESIEKKKFNDAVGFFEVALELKPDDLEALFYRGTALIALGQWLEAFEDFSLVIHKSREEHVPAYALVNRGIIALQLGQEAYACKDWKRVKFEQGHPGLVDELLELNCLTHE
jgi:tetratricopeptide (TPR) repeat protein